MCEVRAVHSTENGDVQTSNAEPVRGRGGGGRGRPRGRGRGRGTRTM